MASWKECNTLNELREASEVDGLGEGSLCVIDRLAAPYKPTKNLRGIAVYHNGKFYITNIGARGEWHQPDFVRKEYGYKEDYYTVTGVVEPSGVVKYTLLNKSLKDLTTKRARGGRDVYFYRDGDYEKAKELIDDILDGQYDA